MLNRFISDRNGATAIEYGLIAALIGVAIIGAVGGTGGSVSTMWSSNESEISGALTRQ